MDTAIKRNNFFMAATLRDASGRTLVTHATSPDRTVHLRTKVTREEAVPHCRPGDGLRTGRIHAGPPTR
ncbi:hypothetical protein Scel_88110 [Streptomyces cellostaticus]|nr:hypothetical protein Scel_88110 [Streptomyces cellostaticus]